MTKELVAIAALLGFAWLLDLANRLIDWRVRK